MAQSRRRFDDDNSRATQAGLRGVLPAELSATGDRIVLWSSSRPTPVVWAQHADASTVLEHIAIFGAITAPTKLTIHAALADHNAIEAMLSSSDRGFALECALRRMSGLGY